MIVQYRSYGCKGRTDWYQADIDDAKQYFKHLVNDANRILTWFEVDKNDGFIWHWNRSSGWSKFKKIDFAERKRKFREQLLACFS